MFLDHVDSLGKFLKFLSKNIFNRFLKNTVPCEFPLLKLYNFYILISFQVTIKTIFTKSFHGTKLYIYESGSATILKRQKTQISQKIFTFEFMLPDSNKFFDALCTAFPEKSGSRKKLCPHKLCFEVGLCIKMF